MERLTFSSFIYSFIHSAAAWLYKATGEKVYLEAATTFAHKMVRDVTSPFSWENKSAYALCVYVYVHVWGGMVRFGVLTVCGTYLYPYRTIHTPNPPHPPGAAVYLLMFKLTGDVTYADNYKQFMKNFKNSPKTPHGLCVLYFPSYDIYIHMQAINYRSRPHLLTIYSTLFSFTTNHRRPPGTTTRSGAPCGTRPTRPSSRCWRRTSASTPRPTASSPAPRYVLWDVCFLD